MTPQEEKAQQGRKMLEEILEKVKDDLTIAKFMGATIKEWYAPNIDTKQCGNYAEYPVGKEYGVYHDNQAYHGVEYLKYKKDWNWLMKAIDKIESLGFRVHIGDTDDEYYVTKIFYTGYEQDMRQLYQVYGTNYKAGIIYSKNESRILSAYSAIVELIEFYNRVYTAKNENK